MRLLTPLELRYKHIRSFLKKTNFLAKIEIQTEAGGGDFYQKNIYLQKNNDLKEKNTKSYATALRL